MSDTYNTAFLRVKSDDGRMVNKPFEHLSESEMERVLLSGGVNGSIKWCVYLAEKVKWHERFLKSEGYTND